MPDLGAISLDSLGAVAGVVLTLMIFSYLLGDNPLYRLALHLFIGALVGYSFGVVLREVFLLKVMVELAEYPYAVVPPIILGILLLIKGFPRHAYVGNFSMAYLAGVGAAVALSGALLGTLIPQVNATGRALKPGSPGLLPVVNGLLVVVGAVCALMAFNFTTWRRGRLAGSWTRFVSAASWVGRLFLSVAFGVAFAGALTASLSILVGRVQYLIDFVLTFMSGG